MHINMLWSILFDCIELHLSSSSVFICVVVIIHYHAGLLNWHSVLKDKLLISFPVWFCIFAARAWQLSSGDFPLQWVWATAGPGSCQPQPRCPCYAVSTLQGTTAVCRQLHKLGNHCCTQTAPQTREPTLLHTDSSTKLLLGITTEVAGWQYAIPTHVLRPIRHSRTLSSSLFHRV